MNKEFFKNNRNKVAQQMMDPSILIMFAGKPQHRSADEEYYYSPDRNFYYLTGIDKANYALIMTKEQGVTHEYLFVPRRDPRLELYFGRMKDIEDYQNDGFETVFYIDQLETKLERFMTSWLLNYQVIEDVYLDFYRMRMDDKMDPVSAFAQRLQWHYPSIRIHNIHRTICDMRRFKQPDELEMMKKAGEITMEGVKEVARHLRPGVTENELAGRFEFGIRMAGAKRPAFTTIMSAGPNTCVLHYSDYEATVQPGDLVLMDLGAEYGYYAADMTRTLPADGKFTQEQKYYYDAVLQAQEALRAAAKPGNRMEDGEMAVKKCLAQKCIESGLIQDASEIDKYSPHGYGHFLGLDTHDVGTRDCYQEGMVITCEPGIYIPEKNIGIRVEDDMIITPNGGQFYTPNVLREIDDIEAFFANR